MRFSRVTVHAHQFGRLFGSWEAATKKVYDEELRRWLIAQLP